MKLWALSDPHLTLATPSKAMHVFGEVWRDHEARIAAAWSRSVGPQDVVLVPGDISWASRLEDALTDLEFLHRLPGTKVILEAIKMAGSTDGKAVVKAMEGMTYDGPTGKETIRAQDHQVIKDYYLLKGKAKSEMKDADDYATLISSGQSFPQGDKIACKMA